MKKNKFKLTQEKVKEKLEYTNKKIEELGENDKNLYEKLKEIRECFDQIRNVPSDKKLEYENVKKIQNDWKEQVDKIEADFKKVEAKVVGKGAAAAGLGFGAMAAGPTIAMGVATTFGVASTGTAISSLSGAAATNAALAWLGGGTLAAGGGGMAGGEAVLALAGPIGWAIVGVSLITSGIVLWLGVKKKKIIENIFICVGERDIKSYDIAIVELNERIKRIKNETVLLKDSIKNIKEFGLNYLEMSEQQQYTLGSYVNLMLSSTQLLVNKIEGIQPKYTEEDLEEYINSKKKDETEEYHNYSRQIIFLSNLLYKIPINDDEKELLWKTLRKNKKIMKSLETKKKFFKKELIDMTLGALEYKYSLER